MKVKQLTSPAVVDKGLSEPTLKITDRPEIV
jgi:hypothetical protein